jgi:hypothetical protein
LGIATRRADGGHGRLHERKQCLARAIDRQQHRVRIEAAGREGVAARQPRGARLAQLRQAGGGRIAAEFARAAPQRLDEERWRWVLRLPDRHGDGTAIPRWGDAGLQARQTLERIGVQRLEARVHAGTLPAAG